MDGDSRYRQRIRASARAASPSESCCDITQFKDTTRTFPFSHFRYSTELHTISERMYGENAAAGGNRHTQKISLALIRKGSNYPEDA